MVGAADWCGINRAVLKATTKSPLPWPNIEPVRASPAVARAHNRPSWSEESGASVARMIMIERAPAAAAPAAVIGATQPEIRQ